MATIQSVHTARSGFKKVRYAANSSPWQIQTKSNKAKRRFGRGLRHRTNQLRFLLFPALLFGLLYSELYPHPSHLICLLHKPADPEVTMVTSAGIRQWDTDIRKRASGGADLGRDQLAAAPAWAHACNRCMIKKKDAQPDD